MSEHLYDQQSEEAVLGAVIMYPDELSKVAQILQTESFFLLRHEYVWSAIMRLYQNGYEIDYLTVVSELQQAGRIDEIGGTAFITYLINNTVTPLHVLTYAQVVADFAQRRSLLYAATQIAKIANNFDVDIEGMFDKAFNAVLGVNQKRITSGPKSLGEALADYIEQRGVLDALPKGVLAGHSTGFYELDKYLQGLKPDYLYTLSGVTGLGKTSLVLHLARGIAAEVPHPVIGSNTVVIFSTEMSTERIAKRMLAAQLKMDSISMDYTDTADLKSGIDELSPLPVVLRQARGWTIERLMNETEAIRREYGKLGLIIVDYIGELESAKEHPSRAEELGYIVRCLKNMTSTEPNAPFAYGCPVIAVSQINRTTSLSGKPTMFGLSDSTHIEKASDGILFAYYGENDPEDGTTITLELQKHRDGRTGKCKVYYDKTSYWWGNLAEMSLSEWNGK